MRELTLLAGQGWHCIVALAGGEPAAGTDAETMLSRWRGSGGHVIDRAEDIPQIPDAFETCRLQKRPFVLFLTRRLVKGDGASA